MSDLIAMSITLMAAGLVVYHHVAYPILLSWLANKQPTALPSSEFNHTEQNENNRFPHVSVIIPAYNEAQWIREKIYNLATLDYPADKLFIVIACDGCSDDTASLARRAFNSEDCAHLRFEIKEFKQNRGKVAVLNECIEQQHSELVALSDVSSLISIDALKIAAKHFANTKVGVVNSHYQILSPGSEGEDEYWRYQSKVKLNEAKSGSVLGAHGALYLFRRSLFQPLESDTINDDFVLPVNIVAQGYRAIHEPHIHALELEHANISMDHKRRRRIAAGNLQQLLRFRHLLNPKYKGVAFTFASGKALRVFMPWLMLITLVGSLSLAQDYWLFALLSLSQLAVYAIALFVLWLNPSFLPRIAKTLAYLVSGYIASLIGSTRYLMGLETGRWQRVDTTNKTTVKENLQ